MRIRIRNTEKKGILHLRFFAKADIHTKKFASFALASFSAVVFFGPVSAPPPSKTRTQKMGAMMPKEQQHKTRAHVWK